jgi:hypothetical protein
MFHFGLAKARLSHPLLTITSHVVKAAGCLYQHVQAHQEAEGVLSSLVINKGFKDNQGAAFW